MKTKKLIMVAVILSLAVLLAACSGGGGGVPAAQTSVKLAQTDQTTVSAAGDDGDLKKGVTWPIPRFTNADGTAPVTGSVVVDQLTGLMWLQDANCIQTRDAVNPGSEFDKDGTTGDGAVSWQHALDFVAGINVGTYPSCGGGYTDWRLPNRKEHRSLINYGQSSSAAWLNTQGFNDTVQAASYWSSTTYAGSTSYAWYVHMYGGYVNVGYKSDGYYVWLVRSGQ